MRCLMMLFATSLLFADLNSVMSEPNLEKRSDRALDNAEHALTEARKAYHAADNAGFKTALQEVGDSVDLSYNSLKSTGKSARRNPKYFKRAEMRLRDLTKRLDNLEKEMAMDDRPAVSALKKRVDQMNDQLVQEIFTKK